MNKRLLEILTLMFSVSLVFCFTAIHTKAETRTNNNGIKIPTENYNNLLSLGFTEAEILNMGEEAYELNKDLKGEIISSKTQYLRVIETDESSKKKESSSIKSTNESPVAIELDKSTYEAELAKQSNDTGIIRPRAIESSEYHSYKTVKTVIVRVGQQHYRLKQSVTWDKMPQYRGVDITGIGINAAWGPASKSQYGEQKWTTRSRMSGKQTHSAIYNSSSTKWIKDPQGYALNINLPNDDIGGGPYSKTVQSLSSYIYYNVTPVYANKRLDAYGQYQHQKLPALVGISVGFSGFAITVSPLSVYDTHPKVHITKMNP